MINVPLDHELIGGIEFQGFYAGIFSSSQSIDSGGEGIFVNYGSDVDPGSDESDPDPHQTTRLFALESTSVLGGVEASVISENVMGGGRGNLNFFAGPRFIYFEDQLAATVQDDGAPSGYVEDFSINSLNRMIGLQVGLSGEFEISDQVSIGGRVAAGLYANIAQRDRELNGSPMVGNPSFTDSVMGTGLAQSVEFAPHISMQVSDNASVDIGGMVLWLNNVNQASSHFVTVSDQDDANVRTNSSTLFYGATAGFHVQIQ